MQNKDKVYIVTMKSPFGTVDHKFSASSKELAARSATNKYPHLIVIKVREEKGR